MSVDRDQVVVVAKEAFADVNPKEDILETKMIEETLRTGRGEKGWMEEKPEGVGAKVPEEAGAKREWRGEEVGGARSVFYLVARLEF